MTPNNATNQQQTQTPQPLPIEKGSKVFMYAFLVIAIIATALHIRSNILENRNKLPKKKSGVSTSYNGFMLPKDSTYKLTRGDTVTVEIPSGVTVLCSSGGTSERPHKYFHRNQNDSWEVWGDGTKHMGETGAYIQMTAYDTTIYVNCQFSK